jgi:nucleotide-binding universal stress UspA family protein
VEFAARFAELTGGELTVAMVGERPSGGPLRAEGDGSAPRRELAAGDATLNRVSPIFHALEIRPRIVEVPSDPFSTAITTEAGSGNYDLVVVGSENRAVQHRLFFGRDNERLIREAPVTVAIVVPNVALLR